MRRSLVGIIFLVAGCTTGSAQPDMGADLTMVFAGQCSDGAQDGDETDVDCGGDVCKKCDDGKKCFHGSDCGSGVCDNNLCASSCKDGTKNGMETDVDCGGPTCPACADGKSCLVTADCTSMNCLNNVCAAGPCMDNMKDGMETDVDCGGPTCSPCDNGKACLVAADCKSMHCLNNVCQGPINCTATMANCDGNPMTGCNINLNTDPKNCGKCANVCPMNMPSCAGGKCVANSKKVLLCYDDTNTNGVMALKTDLLKKFATVDTIDCAMTTPDVPTLQKYNAVLTWAGSSGYADSTAIGNNFKQYVDGGGGVVVGEANFSIGFTFALEGQWAAQAYNCFGSFQQVTTLDLNPQPADPKSPLAAGVTSLMASGGGYREIQIPQQRDVVWEWSNGDPHSPAVVSCVRGGHPRVDLDFMPDPKYWQGDGFVLIENALTFVAN